jgi:hypothetical protein
MISFVKVGSVRAISRFIGFPVLGKEAIVVISRAGVKHGRTIDGNKPRRRKRRRRFIIVVGVGYGHGYR